MHKPCKIMPCQNHAKSCKLDCTYGAVALMPGRWRGRAEASAPNPHSYSGPLLYVGGASPVYEAYLLPED